MLVCAAFRRFFTVYALETIVSIYFLVFFIILVVVFSHVSCNFLGTGFVLDHFVRLFFWSCFSFELCVIDCDQNKVICCVNCSRSCSQPLCGRNLLETSINFEVFYIISLKFQEQLFIYLYKTTEIYQNYRHLQN